MLYLFRIMLMSLLPLFVTALMLCMSASVMGNTLQRFVDAQGIVHLSNVPPNPMPPSVVSPLLNTAPSADLNALIEQTATHFGLDPHLLHALVQVESAYDVRARSPKGAIGLMQLMPDTGRRFGATVLDNPVDNLRAGSRYLSWLYQRFSGNLPLTLAAYNAGEGAVAKFGNRIPPYPETASYVAKVLRHYRARSNRAVPLTAIDRQVVILSEHVPPTTERW